MVELFKVESIDISQILSFHAENKKYEIIDYSSNKMNVDYVKKKYPLLSIIIPSGQCIFTEITMDMYKYKNISNKSTIYVINPEENTYILFDSSKFYCGKGTKINIYEEVDLSNVSSSNQSYIRENIQNIEYESNINLKKIIYEPINFLLNPGKLLNTYNENNYNRLYETYGNIVDDLLPYIENNQIDTKNRFNRMKVVKNIISKDVCFWIMNECEKQEWIDCKYLNYPICVSIEKIPGVLNYVLYTFNYWIDHIKSLYEMNIKLNIKDIFIAKNNNSQKRIEKINDDAFIALNIQLDNMNNTIIYNNDSIQLEQGDMIVYNKKTLREKCNNYVLVLMIDFNLT